MSTSPRPSISFEFFPTKTDAGHEKLLATARYWLRGRTEQACRFDVVLMDAAQEDRIQWLRNAFGE